MNEDRILQYIEEHPGSYLREIRRGLKISIGSAQYNLYRLERKDKIISIRRGLHKFYFLMGVFGNNEINILQVLNQRTSRKILLAIIEGKNPTQTDIVKKVKLSNASIHRYIAQLLKFKIIKEESDGKYKRYKLIDTHLARLVLTLFRNYYSNSWIRWSESLAEMYFSISDNGKPDK